MPSDLQSKIPAIVNPDRLRPLPSDMWGLACACCDKPIARWAMKAASLPGLPSSDGDIFALCSLCFLYESQWGRNRLTETEKLVKDVEKEIRAKFQRAQGRLVRPMDADRIMAAIALTSRLIAVRGKQAAASRE